MHLASLLSVYFWKNFACLMHLRRSCLFIKRSSPHHDRGGSRPLLAAAATRKRKGAGRQRRTNLLRQNLTDPISVQLRFDQHLSLPLLTGRGYLYPKKLGKQPVSTQSKSGNLDAIGQVKLIQASRFGAAHCVAAQGDRDWVARQARHRFSPSRKQPSWDWVARQARHRFSPSR